MRNAKPQKLVTEDRKTKEENRGTLWHFLENECGPEERELVRDFLLPTAAALALSLPQVIAFNLTQVKIALSLPQVRIASLFQCKALRKNMSLDDSFNPR